MKTRALRLLVVILLLGLVACDQATKHAATSALADGRVVSVLPGVFDLRLAHNTGVAFSALDGRGAWLLALLQLAGVALLSAYWWRSRRAGASVQIGLALIVGGAIANLWDRVARGAVVDYLHLAHWPIFNVADVAIVAGGLLLALHAARLRRVTSR